ncbi:hypothetical protein Bhyg_09101 [Pseudolycoriella hygida]|uniref:Chitin-binding type-4 domain-containing protein n=1 Tax=Pseudolycoriella hygida TaxID=35572 RepID=A0A9Q0N667_9DIPT|nr:hypothetical protein Bhyg_09101 [Pseudolycoriella hygida]
MYKFLLVIALAVVHVSAHGRLWRPISRSSVWRDPAFASHNPPQNWDDIQLWCGAAHQPDNPGTNCGPCGDPVGQARPRDNEIGGRWDRGIITGRYTAGGIIPIEVQLTAAHLGFFEFRICNQPGNHNGETQACFNQHLLQRTDGGGSRVNVDGPRTYSQQFRLPANLRCTRCVLQWNYRAGNNWGTGGACGAGVSGLGCGPQETFRGCADIAIS